MTVAPTIFIYTAAASQTIGCPSGTVYTSDIYGLIYNPAAADVNFLISIGCVLLNQRNNVTTNVAPTASDDYTRLYGTGSSWFVISSGQEYRCENPGSTPGTAVWVPTSSGTSLGLSTAVIGSTTISSPYTTCYVNISGAVTVTLESTYLANSNVTFIDVGNNLGTHPLTITPTSGTIRGSSSFVMATNGEKETFNFDGTNWW